MSDDKPVFIFRAIASDIGDFRALAEQAVRLKKHGRVEMTISGLAQKARYEIPEGGNAWHEYASNNPALHKFFPHERIAPFIPAEFVQKNVRALQERLEVIRELGLGASFWAGEPAFLPEAFFRANPHLRGPRVDHPRRSKHEVFAPCIDHQETLEMFAWMMAELVRRVPELGTFCFKTNDAGSGICWADWLYSGPNGPASCRQRSTGQRVAEFMGALREAAVRAGGDVRVFMTPQFRPGEMREIALLLPDGCHMDGGGRRGLRGGADSPVVSVGCSMLNACYPMKAILDPLPVIRSASQIKIGDKPTVFLNARVYYNRDVELIEVWRRVLDVIEKCIEAPVSGLLGTLGRLREHCADWAGQDNAEELMETFAELSEALRFQFSALGPLSTIYFGVSLRHITRPLAPIPARLRQDEEDYWLPHVFNIWPDQAREDYLDFHGGEVALVSIGALVPFLRRLNGIADRLERIAGASRDAFLGKMAIALRIHAAVLRSVGNFHQMQTLRNRNREKLAQTSRPSKVGDWAGDADLQQSNELMRDELDNTCQLIDLLKTGGMDLIAHAKDPADEDTFLLGPDLVGQLTKKCEIMRRHWLDIEDHLSTPLK